MHYRISINKRKYSSNPIVRVTVGPDGKEQEEIIFISILSKKNGDELSERIVNALNKELRDSVFNNLIENI